MQLPKPHAQSLVCKEVDSRLFLDSKNASSDVNELESLAFAMRATAESVVGRLNLNDAMTQFRNTMVDVAMNRGMGSRRAAAKILGVTRPAVQYILRRSPLQSGVMLRAGQSHPKRE